MNESQAAESVAPPAGLSEPGSSPPVGADRRDRLRRHGTEGAVLSAAGDAADHLVVLAGEAAAIEERGPSDPAAAVGADAALHQTLANLAARRSAEELVALRDLAKATRPKLHAHGPSSLEQLRRLVAEDAEIAALVVRAGGIDAVHEAFDRVTQFAPRRGDLNAFFWQALDSFAMEEALQRFWNLPSEEGPLAQPRGVPPPPPLPE